MSLWTMLFGPPNADRFAAMMMREIRNSGENRPIAYNQEGFQLTLPNGSVMALANAYQEYCRAPRRERQGILQRYARFAGQMEHEEQPLSEVQGNLLPKVRDRYYWDAVRLQMQLQQGKAVSPSDLPPHQLLNDHLVLELVIDLAEAVRSVSKDDLARWGLTFEQALAVAKENLWKRSNRDFKEVAQGVYVSSWRDNHDASRLYLHDLIWQLKVSGDHVAAVPNRDVLIVTGSENAAGLGAMAAMIEEALKLPRPMLAVPLRLEGKQWVPLRLEPSHPAYWAMRKLEVVSEAEVYADQKQLLEAIHQKAGSDVFVASCTPVQKQGGPECSSYSVWSEGVDTLLPHAAEVVFMADHGGKPTLAARVAWEHAQAVVGSLMEPQGLYPERYRVQQFPTAQQLEAMNQLQGTMPVAGHTPT